MSEPQAAQPSSRGNRRWRGGRGGRGRRGRGGHQGSERPNQTQGNQAPRTETVQDVPTPGFSSETPSTQPQREIDSGSPRGGRPRRGRGRGGALGQRSIVVSHRNHGRPGATPGASASNVSAPGLNVVAPEFVPGQPVATSSAGPQIPVSTPAQRTPQPAARRMSKSTAADLPTRIQEDIENGQYECVICTNEVVKTSRIWSCSTCWTVTHLHCVKKWHINQMKQKDENQHPNQAPGWRCPGCNSSLTEDPGPYHCWCAKEMDPKPIPGIPSHSCAQSCSKTRNTCPHPCPLMCHAGPCPPCTLMGPTQTCFCGKHTVTKKCIESDYGKGWSCGEICGDLLPCGEHTCSRPCHPGLCGACEVPVLSTCYCGKEQRTIPCDQRDEILDSFNYGQVSPSHVSDGVEIELNSYFEGSFNCKKICGRKFDCGHHGCRRPCHPQDENPAHCPFSPDVVDKCPCGQTSLSSIRSEPRHSCQDPIPHCDEPCNKPLGCGHLCLQKCHTGPCPSCVQYNDVTCRCGRTTVHSICHQGEMERPMCFRICKAQLNCGRHECGEHCCPGEKKAADRRKQKRTANENFEAEHICLQVCGRQLKCGKHICQQLCHRGPCGSCPEAIFDEIACTCGRTVLQPPQPCGTKAPECRFECTKAQRCGHPSVSHHCHPEDTPCPKCPFLVEKACICGKKVLKNQPCWFEEARCGLPCGKKLKCGTHECRKPCHKPGECEDAGVSGSHCTQPCGKTRKSCDHPCTDQCHAPYPCKEDKPCELKALITCPCQNRKQEVRCLSSKLNPWSSRETALKCDDECLRLQRNRLLASALNIDPSTHTDNHIPYSSETLKLFREDATWAQTQEREFRVFASAADEKRLRFKPMPPNKRRFLHLLAEDFGFDSESEDPEPHRHVSIFKTPRFVSAPHKTLAQCVRILKAASGTTAATTSARQTTASVQKTEAFNALLLKNTRFALTIEEVDQALAADLASASRSGPALKFTTSFLPSEEAVIKAMPVTTAAAVATSLAATPQSIESTLTLLKPALVRTVSRLGLAGGVQLCHADSSLNITRKEGDTVNSSNGWNAVASRGTWRRAAKMEPTSTPAPAPRSFLALRRVDLKKEKEIASVEDDWLSAAEKLESEEEGKGNVNKEEFCSEDGEEGGARHQEQGLGDSPSGSAMGASV